MNPDLHAAKEIMRRSIRAELRALNPAFHAEASLVICELAAQLPAFMQGDCVAFFAPLSSEPDIHPLIEEAWAHRKRVVLPRMIKNGTHPALEWRSVAQWSEVIEPGPFGLREPDPSLCPEIETSELTCAFIPGMAFDDEGFRLGRGGGFYDCFLSQTPARLACFGLMFGCQQVPKVPREAHDQSLSSVITEDGLYRF